MICGVLPGPYRVPAYRSLGHFRLTNKTPAATYRAPGRYETTFIRERLIDAIAAKLGIDPIEVRRRNADHRGRDALSRARSKRSARKSTSTPATTWGCSKRCSPRRPGTTLQADLRRRRAAGELVGAGIAMFVEKSGLGPADGVRIAVDTSGAVEVITGGASIGQGFETVMAQVAAETIGVDIARVRVTHGQTDRIEFGIGAHASRATVMTASATQVAALKLRDKALDMAAQLMQAAPDDLDIVGGVVAAQGRRRRRRCRSAPSRRRCCRPRRRSPAASPGYAAEGWFNVERQVYPYGSHVAVVKVDARHRRRRRRALRHRLRRRPRHQPDAGQGPDRRRLRPRAGRRADGGVPLQRERRSAVGDLRRLPDADGARDAARSRSCSPRISRPTSIRSASRAPAKAASPVSARRSPPRSTTPSACRAPSPRCRSRRRG